MSLPASPPSFGEPHFQSLLEASPAGVILVDHAARIRLVNRRIEEWFGYSRDELVGQFIEILVPDSVRPYHAPLRDGYLQSPTVRPIGVNLDLKARRKDGSEFPCDISLHPLPVADDLQVMVHIVDITERRKLEAERRQRESLQRLRFMIEHLPAGAVYVSAPTIAINRTVEAITGYTRQELRTVADWFARLFRDRADEVRSLYEADRAARFPDTRTLEAIRKDGQPRWVEFSAFADEHHEVWLLHDVTERMRAQQRLLQGERLAAIGEMMTALAHESRNALQRAQACLEMLELDLEGQPALLNLTQRTQSAVDELQRLYEEVRGYAAPLRLDLQKTDLPQLAHDVWQNLTADATDRRIAWECCGDAIPLLLLDRHRLAQVLRNIFENALAVLPSPGGKVVLSCRRELLRDQPAIRVSVRDNGPGLSPEQRTRIFEPFYTTKARGTGLGMAIARRIMEAHGGEIAVGDAMPGAEIVFWLPLRDGE